MTAYVLTPKDNPVSFLRRINLSTGNPIFTSDILEAAFIGSFEEAQEAATGRELDIQAYTIRRGEVAGEE